MKRVIAIILSLAVIFTLVCIPTFAATEDSSVNNLLVYDTYTINEMPYNSPSSYVVNAARVEFGSIFDEHQPARLVIGINADTQPSSVQMSIYGAGTVYFNYLYSHESIHYFESSRIVREWASKFSVMIRWGSFDGVFSIESFYYIEQYSNFYELDSMKVHLTGTAWNGEDLSYFVQDAVNETVALPYSSSLTPSNFYGDPPIDGYMYDYFTFDLETDYAKQFVFTFVSSGVWPNYYDVDGMSIFGVTLIDGDSYRNLTYTAASSVMESSWKGLPLYRHTIYVDLENIDLSDCSLMFSVLVRPMEEYVIDDEGQVVTDPFWFIRVEEAGYYQSAYEQPWYYTVLSFFKAIYDVVIERLYAIDSNIITWFSKIDQKLDSLFGATVTPPVLDDQQQAIEDSVGDMDSAADDFENSRNELEGLMPEMPSWEDTGLGNLAVDYSAHISQILVIFTAIYENTIITQILTFTFLFALGGFILFGER